ncbi:MAG: metallophosphoesterase [Clostridia bacterium]|nr:metallophosphoesterase [Clostridia bacterium]
MIRIGLLSDTHGSLPANAADFFLGCRQIWHAGDIGESKVIDELRKLAVVKAVYGNIDGSDVRLQFPEIIVEQIEQTKLAMMHIGGYPGRYTPAARSIIAAEHPSIFISGHSHILKVIFDQKNNLLHLNPGAAGKSGIHTIITMMRFDIDGKEIKNLEIFEKTRATR